MSDESIKARIQAGQYRRQSTWADNERMLFLEDAKKDALTRFFIVMKKYEITDEDIRELLEISQFLI